MQKNIQKNITKQFDIQKMHTNQRMQSFQIQIIEQQTKNYKDNLLNQKQKKKQETKLLQLHESNQSLKKEIKKQKILQAKQKLSDSKQKKKKRDEVINKLKEQHCKKQKELKN